MTRPSAQARQEGSAALELALATPLFLLLLTFLVALGHLAAVQGHLDEAAREAALAASQIVTPQEASAAADREARASLASRSRPCAELRVEVDTTASHPDGVVAVNLTCRAPLPTFGWLGARETLELRSRAVAPVTVTGGVR